MNHAALPQGIGKEFSYPADAPPHWTFGIEESFSLPFPINEISGGEEMDGHGATVIGRWVAWRMLGCPTDDWLTKPRPNIYKKSRWDATRDSAEFICWLMDYTGMDVIWSEGESTGWCGGPSSGNPLSHPKDMDKETDPVKIRKNYANSDCYEPVVSYMCLTALRCSAQIADALGNKELGRKWRSYAEKIRNAMVMKLAVGEAHNRCWRMSPYSVWPSMQETLAQAWLSIYYDGLDPQLLDKEMTQISRNTLVRQLSSKPYDAPALGMGYGMGFLCKAMLILDDMDAASRVLSNTVKYSYDKNMDYAYSARGINWHKWLWLVPEGTNILPDGRWYRIGDLSNGANQGPVMHAIELCAGVDDTTPAEPKIMPRVPDPLEGIEISDFPLLIPDGNGLVKNRIAYKYSKCDNHFSLQSERPIKNLAVRIGPFSDREAEKVSKQLQTPVGSTVRIVSSGTYKGQIARWIWIEKISGDKVEIKR